MDHLPPCILLEYLSLEYLSIVVDCASAATQKARLLTPPQGGAKNAFLALLTLSVMSEAWYVTLKVHIYTRVTSRMDGAY